MARGRRRAYSSRFRAGQRTDDTHELPRHRPQSPARVALSGGEEGQHEAETVLGQSNKTRRHEPGGERKETLVGQEPRMRYLLYLGS